MWGSVTPSTPHPCPIVWKPVGTFVVVMMMVRGVYISM